MAQYRTEPMAPPTVKPTTKPSPSPPAAMRPARKIGTQVSTIDPALRGRWSKPRRLALAWAYIETLATDDVLTHCMSVEEAPDAYRLLADHPEETIGAVLTYS